MEVRKLHAVLAALWIAAAAADYYYQLLTGHFWADHVLPFLSRLF